MAENISHSKESTTNTADKTLDRDYWFRIAERLYQESGGVPDPLEIRSAALISAFGIPSGESSALETDAEAKRLNPKKDAIIAKYLTDTAGVVVDKERGITSSDFRDIYPDGLSQELRDALDPDARAIMDIEYEHAAHAKEMFHKTGDKVEIDRAVHYFRLPGGIDVFLRGYAHNRLWHEKHAEFFQRANAHATVIGIEGFPWVPLGSSLDLRWSDSSSRQGHYDALMHDAVRENFRGFFTEIDARDESKISMDSQSVFSIIIFPTLPDDFFTQYFEFLKREHPSLIQHIQTPQAIKDALIAQSVTTGGLLGSRMQGLSAIQNAHEISGFSYYAADKSTSPTPTFLELGQTLFADALAAVKLHIIAKLMADGNFPNGPIIDYEGALHLSSKSFFLRYPGYAMEIVLRTVNELMAGTVKQKGNISEIYRVFQNPDWAEIAREIARLVFKSVSQDGKTLHDEPVDFLKIYNINPETTMPNDQEIQVIRDKIAAGK